MLNKGQVKLVQTAVRAAGLRTSRFDGRYRLLLARYKQPNGSAVMSCKELNNYQLDDLLAVCESLGWRCPDKPDNFYRNKVAKTYETASFAQQSAIRYLAGDLGLSDLQLAAFLKRMTAGKVDCRSELTPAQAHKVTEALKAVISRKDGRNYKNQQEIESAYMEVARDGKQVEKD